MATNPLPTPAGTPVLYPEIAVGGKRYQLLWGPAARYQLARWGHWEAGKPTPLLALAASMAGTVGKDGVWRSCEFASPFDFASQMLAEESEAGFDQPCAEAIKNTQPGASLTVVREPAPAEAA